MNTRAPAVAKGQPSRGRSSGRSASFLRRTDASEMFNDIVFVGLLLALAWVPFRFGSNHLLTWGINAVLFGLLLIAFELGLLASAKRHPVAPIRLWWAIALFAGFVGWILFQMSPWSPEAWHNALWPMTREIIGGIPEAAPAEGRISVTPDQGFLGLIRLLTCAAAFWLALQLCRDRVRAEMFVLVLVGIAVAYAIYGILQLMLFPNSLLWIVKPSYLDVVTSTFINRNSYATYAGIGLIASVGLLIETYRRSSVGRDAPFAHRLAAIVETTSRRGLPLIVAITIIAIALLLTVSRAGITASLSGIVTLMLLSVLLMRRQLALGIVTVGVLVAMTGALMFYGDSFAERLVEAGGADLRFAVTQRTFEAALDEPWTGFGYGSFDRMFGLYRNTDSFVWAHWDKAHNTYVELLFELGFPATIAFVVLVVGLLAMCVANVLGRESRPMLSLVALAVSVLVFMHATVDFSLQIEAVAITYWMLFGAGLAQSWGRRIDTSI